MLMQEATPEMVERWRKTWKEYKDRLSPNRKTGKEVLEYLKSRYPLKESDDPKAKQVVIDNVLYNEPYAEKLKAEPSAVAFIVENEGSGRHLYENQDEVFRGIRIFAGVELESGYFHVEGSSILWDELYAFRGLDETVIQNPYCVAEYISCLEKAGLLDNTLLP